MEKENKMAQYINKAALVAEIERLKSVFVNERDNFEKGYHYSLNLFISFLNTLDVKEMDINKEISQFIDANFEKATIGHKLSLRRIAKHFYELGLNAKEE